MSAELWAITAVVFIGAGLAIGWWARGAWDRGWRIEWPVRQTGKRANEAE